MYAPPTTLLTLVARCTVTGIANKLKLAGFATHQIGKWDAGMATPEHTPRGRGYDSSFGYFHHGKCSRSVCASSFEASKTRLHRQ